MGPTSIFSAKMGAYHRNDFLPSHNKYAYTKYRMRGDRWPNQCNPIYVPGNQNLQAPFDKELTSQSLGYLSFNTSSKIPKSYKIFIQTRNARPNGTIFLCDMLGYCINLETNSL